MPCDGAISSDLNTLIIHNSPISGQIVAHHPAERLGIRARALSVVVSANRNGPDGKPG